MSGVPVDFEGVSVVHAGRNGSVTALDAVDVRVEPGQAVAVVGPSGCGKSTLLGLIAGFADPSAGHVLVGDERVDEMTEPQRCELRRTGIGFVYQADNLLPFLTVTENVALQQSLAGRSRGEEVFSLLARLGLEDLAGRLPDELSGGQRQRVAVARAVVHRPSLLLCDEPTGALDERNADAVIELLLEQQRTLGSTAIVVTHDPSVAERMDRVVRLRAGAVETDGRVG